MISIFGVWRSTREVLMINETGHSIQIVISSIKLRYEMFLKKDHFHQSSERFYTRKQFGFCKTHSNAHSIVQITQFLREAIEKSM